MSWFDENGEPHADASRGGAERLVALWREVLGRDPRDEELQQYRGQDGTIDIDDRYYVAIKSNLSGTQEAIDHRRQQNNPDPVDPKTEDPDAGLNIAAMLHSGDPAQIEAGLRALARQRGVNPKESSYGTWTNYILNGNGETNDPNYFINRVLNDDAEFGVSGGGGGDGYGTLLDPFTENFEYKDFEAPTADDLKNSPGFQASLDRASNILQRSAAAKGSLLSASTAAALSDQTADLTSQGYGNLFNQKAQEYQSNRGNAYDSYKERRANFYQNQDSPFAKLMAMSSLDQQDRYNQQSLNLDYGRTAAGIVGSNSQDYQRLLADRGNASAAGNVGQSNAYSSLYGMLSQYPWMLAAMRGSGGGGSSFTRGTPGNPNLRYPF